MGVLRDLRPVLSAVEARDTDLARQLRRAAASVALNMAEASGNAGGTRRQRYLSAMGSAREVTACLQVADALGYGATDPSLLRRLGAVIGVLVRVTREGVGVGARLPREAAIGARPKARAYLSSAS
jgi:four helix bundle protein